MVIRIPESTAPKERRRQLELQPILYALKKFGNKKMAAMYLGINPRTMRDIVKRHKELSEYALKENTIFAKMTDADREKYFDMMKRYHDE